MSATPIPETTPPAASYSRRDTAGWVMITGGAQAIRLVVTLASAAILSRLLKPEDFGLVASATPIFALTTMMQNLGINEALMQRPNIVKGHINSLFYFTLFLSGSFMALLFYTAPAIAAFYKEPRLADIVRVMAVVSVIIAAATTPMTLMNRRLRFKEQAGVDVVASVCGIVAGIAFAWATDSYWALVVVQVVTAVVQLVGAFRWAGWVPGWPKVDRELGRMIGLGAGFSTYNLLNFLSRNADLFLIGLAQGPVSLGFYERAYKLTMFPLWQALGPFGRVLSPVLSRLQHDQATYRERFFEATALLMCAVQPGLIAAIIFSGPTVDLILGPGWHNSAPVFFWLGFVGLALVYTWPMAWLFISQGRARESALMSAIATLIAIASFLIGLPFGPAGVAMSYAIGDVALRTPIALWFAGRKGLVDFPALVGNLIPHIFAMACSAAALIGFARIWRFQYAHELLGAVGISYTAYALVLMLFPDKRKLAGAFMRGAGRMMMKPRAPVATPKGAEAR